MELCDTHCHLDFPDFDADRPAVIARAGENGVVLLVNVGTDEESSRRSVALALANPGIYAAVGIHPSAAARVTEVSLRSVRELLRREKVVAVGEAGLDYHYGRESAEQQRRLFRCQAELAAEFGRPLIVHQRESKEDVLRVLEDVPGIPRVVFHCFGGDAELAAVCADRGYFVSFTGTLTFPRADDVRAVARGFPAERIMVETDAPYLSPAPLRGRRNEPARVRLVLEHLARIRGQTVPECAAAVFRASKAFFGL